MGLPTSHQHARPQLSLNRRMEDARNDTTYLRWWELDDTASRYDKIRAAPSDQDLHIIFSVWSAVFFTYATFTVIVFLAITTNRTVRQNTFNLYLIFLMIPDIVYTGFCAIQCAWLASTGRPQSSTGGGFHDTDAILCSIQSVYLVFGICANSYLNAVIAWEIHKLLSNSHQRRRYFSPTKRAVIRNSLIVYGAALVFAVLGILEIPGLPYRTFARNGMVCLPLEYNRASTFFFWFLYFPLLYGIPTTYVIWVTYDVWRNGMIPPPGRRRALAIYFFRIVLVFIVMWMPAVMLIYMASGFMSPWVLFCLGFWPHAQGAVSAAVSLMKNDISQAVKDFVKCRTCCTARGDAGGVSNDEVNQTSTRRGSSRWMSGQQSEPSFSMHSDQRLQYAREKSKKTNSTVDDDLESPLSQHPRDDSTAGREEPAVSLELVAEGSSDDESFIAFHDKAARESCSEENQHAVNTEAKE